MKKFLLAFLLLCSPAFGGSLHTFQDSLSLVNSPNVTAPQNAYVSIVASGLGLTLNDHARPSTMSPELATDIQSLTFQPGDVVSMMVGTNDCQWSVYETPVGQTYYAGFLLEAAIKATLPQRVMAENMTVLSGTWTARNPVVNGVRTVDARFPWSRGVWANTPGQITATVSGTTVYIGSDYIDWAAMGNGTLASSVQIIIDGNVVASITNMSDGPGMSSAQNKFAPYALRFPGLAPGSHTVTVNLISGFIYLEHITGSDQPQGPMLLLATPSTTYQASPSSAVTIPASVALGGIVSTIATNLAADGRNVRKVDVYSLVGPNDVGADKIHWLEATHAKVAPAFITAAGGIVTPPAPTFFPAQLMIDALGKYWGFKMDGTGGVQLSQ